MKIDYWNSLACSLWLRGISAPDQNFLKPGDFGDISISTEWSYWMHEQRAAKKIKNGKCMGHFSAHLYIIYSITVRDNNDNFQKPQFSLTCLFYFFLIAEMCRYLSHKSVKLLICPSFCTAIKGHVTEFWLLARLQFHPQQLMSTFFMMRTAVNC